MGIPVLRKDFTVDEYMIYQAKTLGASAVLLICAILDKVQLRNYRQLAESLGLDALVEIGPGKALSGFVKKTVPELPVYAVETAVELEQLTETLKGASL